MGRLKKEKTYNNIKKKHEHKHDCTFVRINDRASDKMLMVTLYRVVQAAVTHRLSLKKEPGATPAGHFALSRRHVSVDDEQEVKSPDST